MKKLTEETTQERAAQEVENRIYSEVFHLLEDQGGIVRLCRARQSLRDLAEKLAAVAR